VRTSIRRIDLIRIIIVRMNHHSPENYVDAPWTESTHLIHSVARRIKRQVITPSRISMSRPIIPCLIPASRIVS